MALHVKSLHWPRIRERVNLEDWFKLAEQQKLDVLRSEVIDVKRLVKYALGAASLGGAVVGSFATILIEAIVRHVWP